MSLTMVEPPAVRAPVVDAGRGGVRLRVLNGSSGTRASVRSTAAAAAIAAGRDAELFVVHVNEPVEVRVTRLGPTVVRPRRLGDPYSDPVLLEARRVAWANGALARVVLMAGDPAQAILTAADELGVDLIAIGARVVRLPAVIAAPTRYRLQRDAPIPVLAVPFSHPVRATGAASSEVGQC